MLRFIKRESLQEIIAKCAAKYGFSFNSIRKSEAIRGYVSSRNYVMPKSNTSIKNNVMQFFDEKRAEIKLKFVSQLNESKKFSITVDEWTDVLMRRFLNVTVHSTAESFVLGLVHITDSCTSEKTEELVRQRLVEYGLNLDNDIVASTHDGAGVMVKYGRLINVESQLCYNHAIHLAVLKVMYKNPNATTINTQEEEYEDEDADEDNFSDSSNYNNEPGDDDNLTIDDTLSTTRIERQNIKKSLDEMRKTIKFFKKSSIRTEVLNKEITLKEGKLLKLILDCRTRWNTLATSIKRFLKLHTYVNSALDKLGVEEVAEGNIETLTEVADVLEPLKLAVEELSKQESNLLSAEDTLFYIFQHN